MTDYVSISEDFRKLEVPQNELILGCVGDAWVRRVHFKAPRYCDGTDLSAYDFSVQFVNAANESDMYEVDDVVAAENDVTFSWLVGPIACNVVGNTAVSVVVSDVDAGTGDVLHRFLSTTYQWKVLPSTTVEGGEAVEATPYVEQIIAGWQADIDTMIASANNRNYDTVADMQADTTLSAGMICHTLGFHAAGDGGAAYYKIGTTGTANGIDVLACQNSLIATMQITESYVTPEMFGAYGDGVHDDTDSLKLALNNSVVCKPGKSYVISDTINLPSNISIEGLHIAQATHSSDVFRITDNRNIKIINCIFENIPGSAIRLIRSLENTSYCGDVLIDNCTFNNVVNASSWGGGVYVDGQGNMYDDETTYFYPVKNITVNNCIFVDVKCAGINFGGVDTAFVTNCVYYKTKQIASTMALITTSRCSTNIHVCNNISRNTNYEAYIFNNSSNILFTDNIAEDSQYGLVFEKGTKNCIVDSFVTRSAVNAIYGNNNTYAILLNDDLSDISISNVSIEHCSYAVYSSGITSHVNCVNLSAELETLYSAFFTDTDIEVSNFKSKSLYVRFFAEDLCALLSNITLTDTLHLQRESSSLDSNKFKFIVRNVKSNYISINSFASNTLSTTEPVFTILNTTLTASDPIIKDANARQHAMFFSGCNFIYPYEKAAHDKFFTGSLVSVNTTASTLSSTAPYSNAQIGSMFCCTDGLAYTTRDGNGSAGRTRQLAVLSYS